MRRVLLATGVSICRPVLDTIDFLRPATEAMMDDTVQCTAQIPPSVHYPFFQLRFRHWPHRHHRSRHTFCSSSPGPFSGAAPTPSSTGIFVFCIPPIPALLSPPSTSPTSISELDPSAALPRSPDLAYPHRRFEQWSLLGHKIIVSR